MQPFLTPLTGAGGLRDRIPSAHALDYFLTPLRGYAAPSGAEYSETSGVEMKYRAIYEKTATGYSAYAPDLPGCITTGPTLEETERLMKEAIEFHLEGLRQDGLPIPAPTTADYIVAA